jgi:ribosomal protein S18 acetylase RimI-like enzyme
MKYRNTGEYGEIAEKTSLVPFSTEYRIGDFDCGIEDYNLFLINDAKHYIESQISSVHLLIDDDSKDVIGYIALLADAFRLDKEEKRKVGLEHIPFNSVPALKIGKLAISKNHRDYHYGSYLLELSLGFAQDLIDRGVACRFLTVDADIEFNPNTPHFYEINGFVYNEHREYRNRTHAISMRYDLFEK